MTTIKLPREEEASGRLRELYNAITRREEQVFGTRRVSNIWLAMAHAPEYLEANWNRSRVTMQRGQLSILDKEVVAAGVALAIPSRYEIDAHLAAVMRMGLSEAGVTELLSVVEHTFGLASVGRALLVESDLAREILPEVAGLVVLPTGDELDAETRATLDEIRARERELTGVDRVPNLWRAMSLQGAYLRATWAKHKIVMAEGELSVRQKQTLALAVAMSAGSRYWIERLTRTLLRAGQKQADIVEIASIVDHVSCLSRVADGLQIASDIKPSVGTP